MTQTLDQALQAVIAAEATLAANRAAVTNIQTAIDTATAPMAAAQGAVKDGINTLNSNIDAAMAALAATKVSV